MYLERSLLTAPVLRMEFQFLDEATKRQLPNPICPTDALFAVFERLEHAAHSCFRIFMLKSLTFGDPNGSLLVETEASQSTFTVLERGKGETQTLLRGPGRGKISAL